MLRNDATWEERRAWGRDQAEALLAAWQWPTPAVLADDAHEEALALADAFRRGAYTGRPVQAARAQARLRELSR